MERILDAAVALAVEKGADAVTMSEIAQRADVVIGALYRYFSDKSAINKAILQRHYDEVDAMLVAHLSGVSDVGDLIARVQAIYEIYFEMHQKDPVFKSIWSIVQTDAELQALDIEDTLKNTKFVYSVCKPLLPKADSGRLMATCAFILHFAASTARLAPALPRPIGKAHEADLSAGHRRFLPRLAAGPPKGRNRRLVRRRFRPRTMGGAGSRAGSLISGRAFNCASMPL